TQVETLLNYILVFCFGLSLGWRLWAKNPPLDDTPPEGIRTFIIVVLVGIAFACFVDPNIFGLYGVAVFLGFFGQVILSFVAVATSKLRDQDSLLDGRQLRPMRSLTAGFALPGAGETGAPTVPLWMRACETYKLWIELGPPVTRPDEMPLEMGSPDSRFR